MYRQVKLITFQFLCSGILRGCCSGISDGIFSVNSVDKTDCKGSLVFRNDKSEEIGTFYNTNSSIGGFHPREVELKGCGCFTLYRRPKFKGSQQKILAQGPIEVILHSVGSVKRYENCHYTSYYPKGSYYAPNTSRFQDKVQNKVFASVRKWVKPVTDDKVHEMTTLTNEAEKNPIPQNLRSEKFDLMDKTSDDMKTQDLKTIKNVKKSNSTETVSETDKPVFNEEALEESVSTSIIKESPHAEALIMLPTNTNYSGIESLQEENQSQDIDITGLSDEAKLEGNISEHDILESSSTEENHGEEVVIGHTKEISLEEVSSEAEREEEIFNLKSDNEALDITTENIKTQSDILENLDFDLTGPEPSHLVSESKKDILPNEEIFRKEEDQIQYQPLLTNEIKSEPIFNEETSEDRIVGSSGTDSKPIKIKIESISNGKKQVASVIDEILNGEKEENLDFIDPESRSNEAETKLIETKTELTSPKTNFLEKDLKETETEASIDIKSIMALYEKNLKKASESVLKNSEDLSKFLPFLENNIEEVAPKINADSFAFAAEPMILEEESSVEHLTELEENKALKDSNELIGLKSKDIIRLEDESDTESWNKFFINEVTRNDIITSNDMKTASIIKDESIFEAPETSVSESSLYLNQKSDILHAVIQQEKTTQNPFHNLPDSLHLKATLNSYNSSVASCNWCHKNFILVFSLNLYLYLSQFSKK